MGKIATQWQFYFLGIWDNWTFFISSSSEEKWMYELESELLNRAQLTLATELGHWSERGSNPIRRQYTRYARPAR